MPPLSKPTDAPRAPPPGRPASSQPEPPSRTHRRLLLEAQKRYMDDRFGEDRPMNRQRDR